MCLSSDDTRLYLALPGEDWELVYTASAAPSLSTSLCLTADGEFYVIWDDIEVGVESTTPVSRESWSAIKALFR
jgi:hypothetical protein